MIGSPQKIVLFAFCVALVACEQKASSFRNGQSEPGAGNGQRGGANDGTAAGKTGDANTAGGKYNSGAPAAEKPAADVRGKSN